jgi:hypothetical protein
MFWSKLGPGLAVVPQGTQGMHSLGCYPIASSSQRRALCRRRTQLAAADGLQQVLSHVRVLHGFQAAALSGPAALHGLVQQG